MSTEGEAPIAPVLDRVPRVRIERVIALVTAEHPTIDVAAVRAALEELPASRLFGYSDTDLAMGLAWSLTTDDARRSGA